MSTRQSDDPDYVQVRCDHPGCDKYLFKYHRNSYGWIRMSIPCRRCGELKLLNLNLGRSPSNQAAMESKAK